MVNLAEVDAASRIMRLSNRYPKGPQYNVMLPGLISNRDLASHGQRRRLFAKPLSKRSLEEAWEPLIRQKAELAVSCIYSDAITGSADVLKWFSCFANDVVTTLFFGESFNMLETGKVWQILFILFFFNELINIGDPYHGGD